MLADDQEQKLVEMSAKCPVFEQDQTKLEMKVALRDWTQVPANLNNNTSTSKTDPTAFHLIVLLYARK